MTDYPIDLSVKPEVKAFFRGGQQHHQLCGERPEFDILRNH